jgi:hypothetical protein
MQISTEGDRTCRDANGEEVEIIELTHPANNQNQSKTEKQSSP